MARKPKFVQPEGQQSFCCPFGSLRLAAGSGADPQPAAAGGACSGGPACDRAAGRKDHLGGAGLHLWPHQPGLFPGISGALVLAALSARFPWVETLLRPYILAIQTVPVASFIVIALLWLSSRRISAFIAFLMVLPVLYANALQGIRGADRQLLEMARVFRLSGLRRVRCIILPSLAPYLKSACHVALGLCWKAGVAAEVMAVANRSVGGMLYDAKVYLEISDLFAWTVLLVAVSILFEKAFLWLLDLCVNRAIRWEG